MTNDLRRRILSVDSVSGVGYINDKSVKVYTIKKLTPESREKISRMIDGLSIIEVIDHSSHNIE